MLAVEFRERLRGLRQTLALDLRSMASIRVRDSFKSAFTILQFRASFGLAEDVGHPDLVYKFFGTGRWGSMDVIFAGARCGWIFLFS